MEITSVLSEKLLVAQVSHSAERSVESLMGIEILSRFGRLAVVWV